ncbi:phosphoribosyltransferase-like protein [Chryseobacterium gambrini]|uniref:phosphoribosyltransferase-like protein n=1 Tax=Chryseobacterium gambrini TaxID=373672 RepID=UPI003BA5F44D
MSYTFEYDKKYFGKIEHLLPRLKYSVLPSKIIQWLENFEYEEIDNILTLMLTFEFITYNELLMRFDDLFSSLIKSIPSKEGIIFIPYGKIGKSSTLITYPLTHTPKFRRRKNIAVEFDYEKVPIGNYQHVVFIDDFVGSGHSFCKEFSKESTKKWISDNNFKSITLLASITMFEAKRYLELRFPELLIKSEFRAKILCENDSPLKSLGNLEDIKNIILKYEKSVKYLPLGYSNSESFLSFSYGSPNNTLPIIWVDNGSWKSLFPRFEESKISEARKIKKEFAFFIGIYKKLGLNILGDDNINYIFKTRNNRSQNFNYSIKEHHSLVALLFLRKNLKMENILICQLLGLTLQELEEIYIKGIKYKFFSKSKDLTMEGINLINSIIKNTRKENFRSETEERLLPKNILNLPKQFKGKT